MAIKIGGTTVINDSRALTNIASVDATTVAALGAAGVGGGRSRRWCRAGQWGAVARQSCGEQCRCLEYGRPVARNDGPRLAAPAAADAGLRFLPPSASRL